MLKQFDKIMHPDLGEGCVVHVQYRRKNSLVMIYMLKDKNHEFMLEKDAMKYLVAQD